MGHERCKSFPTDQRRSADTNVARTWWRRALTAACSLTEACSENQRCPWDAVCHALIFFLLPSINSHKGLGCPSLNAGYWPACPFHGTPPAAPQTTSDTLFPDPYHGGGLINICIINEKNAFCSQRNVSKRSEHAPLCVSHARPRALPATWFTRVGRPEIWEEAAYH
jgi:hypothetical protein